MIIAPGSAHIYILCSIKENPQVICYTELMKKYTGSCHCGAITFAVQGDFNTAVRCNCSHCSRKGFLLAFVPALQFSLLSGQDAITTYQFNQKKITHQFCRICGIQPFADGSDSTGASLKAINLNCLDDLDIASLAITEVDGKSF